MKKKTKLEYPQGSILGRLLFLIFINDLPPHIQALLIAILFADDTTLIISGFVISEILARLDIAFKYFSDWCHYNKLDINWDKTVAMIVTNKRIEIPKNHNTKQQNILG